MRNERIRFSGPNKPLKLLENHYLSETCKCDTHIHREIEFIYVLEGYVECCTEKGKFTAEKGDIVLFNSMIPHSTEDHSDNYLFNFSIPIPYVDSVKYLGRFANRSKISHYIFTAADECYAELKHELSEMISIFKYNNICYDFYMMAHIFTITAILYRVGFLNDFYSTMEFKIISKISRAIQYIEENYRKDITIKELSEITGLSISQFCHLFKRATNDTAINYLNFVRVCEAEKLFKTDMNISEICYEVGFSSQSYFNAIFKKYKNCTPSAYRKQNKFGL